VVDLKRLREHAKQSQAWMANFLGVDPSAYSRLEKNPDGLPLPMYLKLNTHFGDLTSYLQGEKLKLYQIFDPERISAEANPYSVQFKKRDMLLEILKEGVSDGDDGLCNAPPYLQWPQVRATISNAARLPNLGVFGRSDSGKSHLLNTLLGQAILPTKFTPTTSLVIQVVHSTHRPQWCQEQVVLMGQGYWSQGDSSSPEGNAALRPYWGVKDAKDDQKKIQEHWDKHCCYRGNLGVLEEFATRPRYDLTDSQKQAIDRIQEEAHTAIVFVDAPILQYCQIVDIPGFENVMQNEVSPQSKPQLETARESELAIKALDGIDLAIFLTPLIGAFNSNDLAMLSLIKRHLEAKNKSKQPLHRLDNLVWVISQVDPSRTGEDVQAAKKQHAHQLVRHFSRIPKDDLEKKVQTAHVESLTKKLHEFWSDANSRREPLLKSLETLLKDRHPEVVKDLTIESITWLSEHGEDFYAKQIERWRGLLEKQAQAAATLKHERRLETEKNLKVEIEVRRVCNLLEGYKSKTLISVRARALAMLNVDTLEKRLLSTYEKNSKLAKEQSLGLLYEQLQNLVDDGFSNVSVDIDAAFKELDKDGYDLGLIDLSDGGKQEALDIPFNLKGASAAGKTSAVAAGAMSIAAASMGNLGGYVLAAKGVGMLSTVGVSFASTGGTAGVMSGIAAIGGPITLGIILSAGVGLAAWRLLGDRWERRLASKLSKVCAERKIVDQFMSQIEDVFKRLNCQAEQQGQYLKGQYQQYLQELELLQAGDLTAVQLESLAIVCLKKRNLFASFNPNKE